MLTEKQKETYDRAVRLFTNLTNWDYLQTMKYPENYREANKNIQRTKNFMLGVCQDIQEIEKVKEK